MKHAEEDWEVEKGGGRGGVGGIGGGGESEDGGEGGAGAVDEGRKREIGESCGAQEAIEWRKWEREASAGCRRGFGVGGTSAWRRWRGVGTSVERFHHRKYSSNLQMTILQW